LQETKFLSEFNGGAKINHVDCSNKKT
jgi:hypothetical protein